MTDPVLTDPVPDPVPDPAPSEGGAAPPTVEVPDRRPRPWLLVLALALLFVLVLADLAAGAALHPAPNTHNQADIQAIPGVAALTRRAELDQTELAQVAARQARPAPSALPAQALLDGLILAAALALARPRLLPRGNGAQAARVGTFVASLAILVGAVAVVVAAIGRLRYLEALYRSPPLGTLSYLLLYGSFRREAAVVALSLLFLLKIGALVALFRAEPRAIADRAVTGLALTSVSAMIVTAACYAWAPPSLDAITNALAASVVALAAALWAAILVSGIVRRVA